MSQELWFSAGGERIRDSLDAAFSWCDQYCIVSDGPAAGERGDGFWALVERHQQELRVAVLSSQEPADLELVGLLHSAGRLRRFSDGNRAPSHFIWFERGDEIRFLLAPARLCATALGGPGLWLCWQGTKGDLPDGLHGILDGALSSSTQLGPGDPVVEHDAAAPTATYSRAIPSVREVLGVRSTADFFDLDSDDQARALWSTLIGEGPVDLERAIRLGAERLRAQGFLEYQALRQDGRVHGAIEERLLAARRGADIFDRPRNGFVRAIQPNIDDLTAEQWRDCLMGALEAHARVDRDQAVRLGFAHAQHVYGVNAQRLRVGGRADQALRSAINSSIRQGFLAREGAAYLVRVSPDAPPTLRGILTSDAQEGSSTERTDPDLPVEVVVPKVPAPLSADPAGDVIETSAASATTSSSEPGSPFDQNLYALDFPTRTLNWADRQGISTVRELVAWQPEHFATERNVGRRTVRETRELLEAHLGCSWEEAHESLARGAQPTATPPHGANDENVNGTTEALTAGGATGWSQLAGSLTDDERAIPLIDVKLPTRMKTFVRAEGLHALGDLFQQSHASLAERANLGRKSLNDTLDAVRDFLSERASPATHATFLQSWHAQLNALEPVARMIVTRRAGMHGTRETLEELGGMLGITRERVRQIEARVIERLSERSRWRRTTEANITAAFGAGRALPLLLLAEDPWWVGIDHHELLLDFVVRRIFADELFLLTGPSGKRYLTKFPPADLDEHLANAKSRLAKLEYPVETSTIEAILHSEVDPLDPILFAEFETVLGELLHLDAERPGVAVGYGRYRENEVLAFLNGQAEPVPVALVEDRCGRGRLPDEVIYFKRGLVGLKRHFPDFEDWTARLVPAALDVMKERPAGRQWLVPEIHDVLHERNLLPDWLGHWHLASLLRLSGQVEYLGRLRVASKGGAQEDRLQYEELLEQLLEEAGGPLDFDDLLARARIRTDIGEGAAGMTTLTAPFVRLDDSRVGLVERDIPGGPPAVAAAIEAVLTALTTTQRGLTPHQATKLVNGVSETHGSWTRQLVTSVLRNEASVRIDRSKNIGLDEWDDVRCPTRPEFIRREVQKEGGLISIAELGARLELVYGRAPDRSQLGVLVTQVGLTITGEHVARPEGVELEPPQSRPGIDLSGIPAELRQMFEELLQEPFSELAVLRAQVKEHVEAIEDEHHVNEFVDLKGAQTLARQADDLLARWESLRPRERQLAHAAIRYFVSWDDFENDLNIGGLDDDKQIMNAVLSYLGIQEQDHGALAS